MTNYKNKAENVISKLSESKQNFTKKLDEVKELEEKSSSFKKQKIAKYRSDLVDVNAQIEEVKTQLYKAITADDEVATTSAEEKLEELYSKFSKISSYIKILESTPSSCAHSKEGKQYIDEALEALKALIKEEKHASQTLDSIEKEINSKIEEAKRELKQINDKRLCITRYGGCINETTAEGRQIIQMVSLYEAAHGVIDVAGHSAGFDAEAKWRFICGITTGIENTAAGRILTGRGEN